MPCTMEANKYTSTVKKCIIIIKRGQQCKAERG